MSKKHVRNMARVALVPLAFGVGCGPRIFPETAETEWQAERIRADCERVEEDGYYALTVDDILFVERERNKVGIGFGGISLHLSIPRRPETAVGVGNQLTPMMDWNDASGEYKHQLVIHVGKNAISQPALRVDARTKDGAIGVDRVHLCRLIAHPYVLFDGQGDIEFSVSKVERNERRLALEVSGRARRPYEGGACGDASVMLLPGDTVVFDEIGGEVRLGSFDSTYYGPEGVEDARKWRQYNYADLKDAPHGSLQAEIDGDVLRPVAGGSITASELSCLSFFVNDTDRGNNSGEFEIDLHIHPGNG